MSIEHGVTQGASKTASHGVAGHGHGKAQGGDAASGDFASLLMNLGADDLPAAEVGALAAPLEGGANPPDAPVALQDADVPASAPPMVVSPQATPIDDAKPAPPEISPDLPQVADIASGSGTVPPQTRSPLNRTAAAADVTGAEGEEATLSSSDEAAPAFTGRADLQQGPEAKPLMPQVALAQRMAYRMQAAQEAAQAVKEQQLQKSEAAGARLVGQASERVAPGGLQAQVLMSGSAEGGLRPSERRAEKTALRHGGMGEVASWGVSGMTEGANLSVPTVAAAAGMAPEVSVAEQVSYWIGRGAQNAELELDGLGEGPVKVSIAMHGQEARVEFRAEQMQTRQMLEGSVSHLRDLLHREGLVLSGVSIGSSGSDGAAGRQSQSRQGNRQAVVALAELPSSAAGSGARGASLTGRTVDLFV